MRHSKAIVAAGSVRTSGHGVRRTIIVAVVAVVALWAAYAFAQEAYIGHKLSQQVADLHRQNARLAAENKGYHKDVQSAHLRRRERRGGPAKRIRPPRRDASTWSPTAPSPTPVAARCHAGALTGRGREVRRAGGIIHGAEWSSGSSSGS